jgi:hypothetical protein
LPKPLKITQCGCVFLVLIASFVEDIAAYLLPHITVTLTSIMGNVAEDAIGLKCFLIFPEILL